MLILDREKKFAKFWRKTRNRLLNRLNGLSIFFQIIPSNS